MLAHKLDLAVDGAEGSRRREYQLFACVTEAMIEAAGKGPEHRSRAIEWNQRLWDTLWKDLASEENRLPGELKERLLSLAEWVEEHCARVLLGEADMEPLVEINHAIMKGLAREP